MTFANRLCEAAVFNFQLSVSSFCWTLCVQDFAHYSERRCETFFVNSLCARLCWTLCVQDFAHNSESLCEIFCWALRVIGWCHSWCTSWMSNHFPFGTVDCSSRLVTTKVICSILRNRLEFPDEVWTQVQTFFFDVAFLVRRHLEHNDLNSNASF